MPGAAPADEAVFTGADDPSASPIAQQIIKQLMDRGIQPTAGNMRRAVEANARSSGVSGPDPLEGVRNDVVENTARPAAGGVRRRGLPTPPIPPEQAGPPELNGPPTAPTTATSSAVPVVDPETGMVISPEGGMDGATIGSLVAMAMPLLYGAKRAFGGGVGTTPATPVGAPTSAAVTPPSGAAATTSAAPPSASPIPGARTGASGATSPAAPVPPPPPAPPQSTTTGPVPGARPGNAGVTTPPPVGVSPAPATTMQSPSMLRGGPAAGPVDPTVIEKLKVELAKRVRPGINYGGTGPGARQPGLGVNYGGAGGGGGPRLGMESAIGRPPRDLYQ